MRRNAWKVSKYRDFSVPYFPAFSLNAGKYGPEKNSISGHLSRSDDIISWGNQSNLLLVAEI